MCAIRRGSACRPVYNCIRRAWRAGVSGSRRCDCGDQLPLALMQLAQHDSGIVPQRLQ